MLRRLLAELGGYFWLPCPRCGRMFAGFEKFGTDVPTPGQPGCGKMACRRCVLPQAEAMQEQLDAWGYAVVTEPFDA